MIRPGKPRPRRLHPALVPCLLRDMRGAAMVEFAMIAPVFVMALIGIFDISYNMYAASVLDGSIQKAARDGTMEGSGSAIDTKVRQLVRDIVPSAEVQITRRAYDNYRDVGRPEDFDDINEDGVCNEGEPFEDVNGNRVWDNDRGAEGFGGARDAVLYTVSVTYDRQFPLHRLMPGLEPRVTTVARTVLRNQPYDMQDIDVTVGNCT